MKEFTHKMFITTRLPLLVAFYLVAWAKASWLDSVGSTLQQISSSSVNMLKSSLCFMQECCNEENIPGDIYKLQKSLEQKVYGQHLVNDIVINAIGAHWSKQYQPKKALTLSFHGSPGSGKNYVSKFIMESLYRLGRNSEHVHQFVARVDFPLETKVDEYKAKLYSLIKESVGKCPKQLFIFDEVDKMPAGVLDAIKPMLDYHDSVEGVDYRRTIFIFLSNTGSQKIVNKYLELWKDRGVKREDIEMSDYENIIQLGAFNEKGWLNKEGIINHWMSAIIYNYLSFPQKIYEQIYGGFLRSDVISANLIDHYVPFLPMERAQVKLCVIDEFRDRGIWKPNHKHIEEAMNFVEYGPSDMKLLSLTGCKRISQKVSLLIAKYYNVEPKKEL